MVAVLGGTDPGGEDARWNLPPPAGSWRRCTLASQRVQSMANIAAMEASPVERRAPGRPKGSKNRNRVATIESLSKMVDPVAFLARALKRGWIQGKGGAREFLTVDQRLTAAIALAKKVLPDARAADISIGVEGGRTIIEVNSGIARLPTDPFVDVTPTPAALPPPQGDDLGLHTPTEERSSDGT